MVIYGTFWNTAHLQFEFEDPCCNYELGMRVLKSMRITVLTTRWFGESLSLSETMVPLSMIQNMVLGGGLALTAHSTMTSESPRYAPTELHVIFGETMDTYV